MTYLLLKYLHVIGATVILGTGSGIAFFMLMAHLSRDAAFVARTAGVVVWADVIFTAIAVIVQPITGYLLTRQAGFQLTDAWLEASVVLFGVAGLFWLPVVWMQIRMRDLATEAAERAAPLPAPVAGFLPPGINRRADTSPSRRRSAARFGHIDGSFR